jgi:hypothetical protein
MTMNDLQKAIDHAALAAARLIKSHVSATTYTNASGTTVNRKEYEDSRAAAHAALKVGNSEEATKHIGNMVANKDGQRDHSGDMSEMADKATDIAMRQGTFAAHKAASKIHKHASDALRNDLQNDPDLHGEDREAVEDMADHHDEHAYRHGNKKYRV